MRRSHIILLVFVLGVGMALYQIKYRVMHLEEQLSDINQHIITEQESLHVLHAELSYATRPEYIARMSARHLAISPIQTAQVRQLADYVPNAQVIPLMRQARLQQERTFNLALDAQAVSQDEVDRISDVPADVMPAALTREAE
jgi:hypothetical protein